MSDAKVRKIRNLLSVLLIIFTVSTLFYTADEMHHECSGDDCHICQVIQISVQSLKLLTFALATVFIAQNFKNVKTYKDSIIVKSVFEPNTLVSQKIRLND
ncbi:MAG: hypothetical protein VZR56_03510 [Treponema sp.]|nr:hypothetical protein [Treponema sp.]